MRVLLTNYNLAARAGSQLYLSDVALCLLKLGHTPIVFSPELGQVAQQLRAATIPVVDDLNDIGTPPDVIHGQQLLETMAALVRFPDTPAVYFHHDWFTEAHSIPHFPRVLRYVAVDLTCRDRLIYENGIPESRVSLILNFADINKFRPREPLPPAPRRALLFSNYARDDEALSVIREACSAANISLRVVGEGVGEVSAAPEKLLAEYDLVFAKGRAAIEALAVGCAVILLGVRRLGPLVTSKDFERLRLLNFGSRALYLPITRESIETQLRRYDQADAREVSRRIRATATRDQTVQQIIDIYQEVIDEHRQSYRPDPEAEAKALTAYLAHLHKRLAKPRAERLQKFSGAERHSTLRRKLVNVPVLGTLARYSSRTAKKFLRAWIRS